MDKIPQRILNMDGDAVDDFDNLYDFLYDELLKYLPKTIDDEKCKPLSSVAESGGIQNLNYKKNGIVFEYRETNSSICKHGKKIFSFKVKGETNLYIDAYLFDKLLEVTTLLDNDFDSFPEQVCLDCVWEKVK